MPSPMRTLTIRSGKSSCQEVSRRTSVDEVSGPSPERSTPLLRHTPGPAPNRRSSYQLLSVRVWRSPWAKTS